MRDIATSTRSSPRAKRGASFRFGGYFTIPRNTVTGSTAASRRSITSDWDPRPFAEVGSKDPQMSRW